MSALESLERKATVTVNDIFAFCENKAATDDEKKKVLLLASAPTVLKSREMYDSVSGKTLSQRGKRPFPSLQNALLYLWQLRTRDPGCEKEPWYSILVEQTNALED